MTPRTIKTRDVAEMLSCSPGTVRRLCDEGKLRFTKFSAGGRYRIFAESVDALLCGRAKRSVSQRALHDEAHAAAARLGIQLRDAM